METFVSDADDNSTNIDSDYKQKCRTQWSNSDPLAFQLIDLEEIFLINFLVDSETAENSPKKKLSNFSSFSLMPLITSFLA